MRDHVNRLREIENETKLMEEKKSKYQIELQKLDSNIQTKREKVSDLETKMERFESSFMGLKDKQLEQKSALTTELSQLEI